MEVSATMRTARRCTGGMVIAGLRRLMTPARFGGDDSMPKVSPSIQLMAARRALRELVEHDVAADHREGLTHCLELERAIIVLQWLDGTVNVSKRSNKLCP